MNVIVIAYVMLHSQGTIHAMKFIYINVVVIAYVITTARGNNTIINTNNSFIPLKSISKITFKS